MTALLVTAITLFALSALVNLWLITELIVLRMELIALRMGARK